MKPTVAVLYGDAGSAALIDAMKAWRKDYAPNAPYEALFAGYIRNTKIQMTMYPRGYATIHVRVEGVGTAKDDDYWYEAQLKAGELKLVSILDNEVSASKSKPAL